MRHLFQSSTKYFIDAIQFLSTQTTETKNTKHFIVSNIHVRVQIVIIKWVNNFK